MIACSFRFPNAAPVNSGALRGRASLVWKAVLGPVGLPLSLKPARGACAACGRLIGFPTQRLFAMIKSRVHGPVL